LPPRHRVNLAAFAVAWILLAVCIWRIETVNDQLEDRGRTGSGQTVTTWPVSTERFVDEPLESWGRRHMEAVEAFE